MTEPAAEPAIDPADIAPDLEQRHRDAMLDLILAWGSLDGALSMLLSRVLDMPFDQGAELIDRMPSSVKLREVRKVLRDAPGGANAARIMKRHKKNYAHHAFARNRIAHSHCVGVWTRNRDYIVFATFEKVGDNLLAIDAVSIERVKRATRWGKAMTALALKAANAEAQAA